MITFDAGQTLVELDLDFLAGRLAERGVSVAPAALAASAPSAWRTFDALVESGIGHPWRALMTALLAGAGVREPDLVEWLWSEQPRANLWRRPITGMVELARELSARGVRVAVLSNSEGKLAELLDEIGIADVFERIIDSGRLGFEKPDPRIFEYTLSALGDPSARPVHIGDSWSADIAGALGAGWRAIWYGRRVTPVDDPRVAVARDPAGVRAALVRWDLL